MRNVIDVQRNRLRRLRLLQYLYEIRPERLGEGILYSLVQREADLVSTPELVREALDYLAQRGLLSLTQDLPIWTARITANGIDFLEGEHTHQVGIAHPLEFER